MPSAMRMDVVLARREDGTVDPAIGPLHTRFLVASPLHLVPKRPLVETFRWLVRPAEGYIIGVVYTGGS